MLIFDWQKKEKRYKAEIAGLNRRISTLDKEIIALKEQIIKAGKNDS